MKRGRYENLEEARKGAVETMRKAAARGLPMVVVLVAVKSHAGHTICVEFDEHGNDLSYWDGERCLVRKPGSLIEWNEAEA